MPRLPEAGADVFTVPDCGVWACVLSESNPGRINVQRMEPYLTLQANFKYRADELQARGELVDAFEVSAKSLKVNSSPELFAEELWRRASKSSVQKEQPVLDRRNIFVIHGRNGAARDAMFEFLRAVGLNPVEWGEAVQMTGKGSPYVGEVLDAAFSNAQAVVAVLTGDDLAHLREEFQEAHDPEYEKNPTPQPRPNVLFEAGMAFGRHPERTIMVQLGYLPPFSDVAGRHTLHFTGTSENRTELRERLRTAKCAVKDGGTDWLKAGNFDEALRLTAVNKKG